MNKKITHLVAFNKRFREIMSHVKLRVYILFNQRMTDCMKVTVHKAYLNSSRRNDLLQIFQFSIVKRENFLDKKIASWNFYLATSLSSKVEECWLRNFQRKFLKSYIKSILSLSFSKNFDQVSGHPIFFESGSGMKTYSGYVGLEKSGSFRSGMKKIWSGRAARMPTPE